MKRSTDIFGRICVFCGVLLLAFLFVLQVVKAV